MNGNAKGDSAIMRRPFDPPAQRVMTPREFYSCKFPYLDSVWCDEPTQAQA
jgi:hypothetical protein